MKTDEIMALANAYASAVHDGRDDDCWTTLNTIQSAIEALQKDAARWRDLYKRAVNEANGLTNYVEDRPELRSAEKRLTAIQYEARAAMALDKP